MWLILFFSLCLYFFHPSAFTYIGRSRPTAAARQAIRPAPLIYSVRKERKKQFLTEAILRAAVKPLAAPAQAVAAGLSAFTARMDRIGRKKARGSRRRRWFSLAFLPVCIAEVSLRLYALFIWLSNLCVCFLHAWGLALPLRPARLCGRSAFRSAARLNDGNNGRPASSLWGSRSLCRSLPRLFRLRIRCCPSVLCPRRLFGIRFLPQRGRRRSVRLVSRIFGRF